MTNDSKQHILIKNPKVTTFDYKAKNAYNSGSNTVQKNPLQQGNILNLAFEASITQSENVKATLPSDMIKHMKEGLYLTVDSDMGTSLSQDRFNNKDIELRSIKDNNGQESLTFFIEKSNFGSFTKKIEEYSNKKTKSGNPKHLEMFNNVQTIRLSNFDAFWNDELSLKPADVNQLNYFEIWLKKDDVILSDNAHELRKICNELNIRLSQNFIRLHGTYIFKVYSSISILENLIHLLPNLIEFRSPSETPKVYVEMGINDQVEFNEDFQDRVEVSQEAENLFVTVLDTGVNYNNQLLSKVCRSQWAVSFDYRWPDYSTPTLNRHEYHGSMQAGICAFGSNLQKFLASNDKINCTHNIESGRILPPSPLNNDEEMYGAVTIDTANKLIIDRPNVRRVFSMAVTSSDKSSGFPTSWSSAIDNFCMNVDGNSDGNLFIISSGNSESIQKDYWENARLSKVQDPAQAWNAITVGSYTKLYSIDGIANAQILCKEFDIGPTTTSSINWDWDKGPIKPEILCEGGNRHILDDGTIDHHDDLGILTASGKTTSNIFDINSDTSAATAEASYIAAKIMAAYPDYNPQTIRGLMIHWAEWTEPFRDELSRLKSISSSSSVTQELKKQILRVCGYGVPDLGRSITSKSNRLTLIIESDIRPFNDDFALNEFNLHDLPWPEQTLKSVNGDIKVTLKVTLSYFIEPNPRIDTIKNKYVYRSHGLIFDLIKPTQDIQDFIDSQNRKDARSDSYKETGRDTNWYFGANLRTLGSVHKDIWEGTASELAEMSKIIIKPSTGWWKLNKDVERCQQRVDYSLILSIEVESNDIDIYTEVANKIKLENTSNIVKVSVNTTY